MKHHFKYASGYINIDEENLYLTSSGNWQETQKLTEKNAASESANKRRIRGNSIFLYAVLIIAAVVVMLGVGKGTIKFGFLMLIFFGLYHVNKYFQREMGSRYKIPLSKIDTIAPEGEGLQITFRNAANQPDFETARGVAEKDVKSIMDLVRDSRIAIGQ